MKKRFLALALCLVLATSLLPLTAAAEAYTVQEVEITAKGVKQNADGKTYGVDITSLKLKCADDKEIDAIKSHYTIDNVIYATGSGGGPGQIGTPPVPGGVYVVQIEIKLPGTFLYNNNIPASLTFTGNAYEASKEAEVVENGILFLAFKLQRNGEHDWRFGKPDSGTLTADCLDSGCGFKDMGVNLTAHSVTLPESPFNAEVQVVGAFQQAFPSAKIGELVYKYKGPGDSEYRKINPLAANAKAGEYQVGVQITGLPISPAAIAARGNQDNAGFADLYVQYTAVDPAITAQTGDNRPIELMLAGLVVFAALAAAAFALDSKRKYSR